MFPYQSSPHRENLKVLQTDIAQVPTLGRIVRAKQRRKQPTSEVEMQMLAFWQWYDRANRYHWRRLSEAMLAAAACGEVEFFMHVADILQRGFVSPDAAANERHGIWTAIKVRQAKWVEANQIRLPCLKSDIVISWQEVDEEIETNSVLRQMLPEWSEKSSEARRRIITRVAKIVGARLSGSKGSSGRKVTDKHRR